MPEAYGNRKGLGIIAQRFTAKGSATSLRGLSYACLSGIIHEEGFHAGTAKAGA
jgi:hypothetical protein